MKPLLLHACCAPCSLEPVRLLREEGFEPAICWTNPNIQPRDEWQRRLDELRRWCADGGIELIEAGRTASAGRLAWLRWAPIGPVAVVRAMPFVWPRHAGLPRSAGLSMWVRRSPSRRISCSKPAMTCLIVWRRRVDLRRSFAIFARIIPRPRVVRVSWACIGRIIAAADSRPSRRPWTAPASATSAKPPKSSSFGTSAC